MVDADEGRGARYERPLCLVMGLVYVVAGVSHLLVPKAFARIVPPRFPRPVALVSLSGIAEVVLGVGVTIRRTRTQSAWGLIALLVAVFPANVHMATSGMVPDAVPDRARGLARLGLWARLPLQGVLVLWAWWYTRPSSDER